jgi:selenocysteine-specific elongation factor
VFLRRPAVAALSTKLSTAALDKNPQSKERGITLDLGFSSFSVSTPALTLYMD